MKLSAIALLLLLTCCTQAFSQESSREDFREFCKLVEGRWVADITWVADWPGVGKKGEKATGYFDVKLDADGHALVGRHYAGSGAGIWTIVYNAAEKKIGGIYVDKSGINHMTYYKKDGKWIEQGSGSLVDGRKTKDQSTMTFTDNGNQMVLDGTGTIDGESHDKRHDVYHRVKE